MLYYNNNNTTMMSTTLSMSPTLSMSGTSSAASSATLVAVCTSRAELDEFQFKKRQIPLVVDEFCPTFIMQFDDIMSCLACEQQQQQQQNHNHQVNISSKQKKDYESFLSKYNQLILQNSSSSSNSSNISSDTTGRNCCRDAYGNESSRNGGGGGVPTSESTDQTINCATCTLTNNTRKTINTNFSKQHNSSSSSNSSTRNSSPNVASNNTETSCYTIEAKPVDLMNTLAQLVPCIGCRTSVERFYKQLRNRQAVSQALDPFLINLNGNLTVKNSILLNPLLFYELFYVISSRLDSVLSTILAKNKKNRRCHLHSLEAQKQRGINDWQPVWDALGDEECRKKALIIETSQLSLTLDQYLRKHKFCSDCKMKVIRAFNILTGELDPSKDKGYCPALYDGLECCCTHSDSALNNEENGSLGGNTSNISETVKPYHHHYQHHTQSHNNNNNKKENSESPLSEEQHQQHIHVRNDKNFISSLIFKAESEIQGSRRERHAKTIDIAQEEVLTCIGIYLYERFHRICLSMRAEEQTWQLLFYTSVLTLKKCFELEFEKRQGISNLELICAEFVAMDESRLSRKQLKRERKKQRKQTNNAVSGNKQTNISTQSINNNNSSSVSLAHVEEEEYEEEDEEDVASNKSAGNESITTVNTTTTTPTPTVVFNSERVNSNETPKTKCKTCCSRSTSASSIIDLVAAADEDEDEDVDVDDEHHTNQDHLEECEDLEDELLDECIDCSSHMNEIDDTVSPKQNDLNNNKNSCFECDNSSSSSTVNGMETIGKKIAENDVCGGCIDKKSKISHHHRHHHHHQTAGKLLCSSKSFNLNDLNEISLFNSMSSSSSSSSSSTSSSSSSSSSSKINQNVANNNNMIHHLRNDNLLTDLESILYDEADNHQDLTHTATFGVDQELSCFSNLNDYDANVNDPDDSYYITNEEKNGILCKQRLLSNRETQ